MTRKKFVTKPQCVVSTSWDDGAPLDCELSRLLNKHKVQATFYVPWKPDNYDRIDDNELKKLARHFEIGAHTLTHPDLTAVPLREAKREILGGKNELSALLNHRRKDHRVFPGSKARRFLSALGHRACESVFILEGDR